MDRRHAHFRLYAARALIEATLEQTRGEVGEPYEASLQAALGDLDTGMAWLDGDLEESEE